jgi:glycosyltransferase involved in cell wall biosynthesis
VADGSDTLVILTLGFPYGRGEEFLEAELRVLARRFSTVIVMPSARCGRRRELPPGVRCETLLSEIGRPELWRSLVRHPVQAAQCYVRAVFGEGAAAAYLRHAMPYFGVVALNLRKLELLSRFIRSQRLEEAVFYDYWLENSTLALSLLRRNGTVGRAVARAHRFDLYDEWHKLGAVPFRAFNIAALDRVFAVSAHGLSYLERRHPVARPKLVLSRLGVERRDAVPEPGVDELPVVVSCARLVAVKRVHLVPAVLDAIGRPVRWVHLGDGPCRSEVERAAARLSGRVAWQIRGELDHADVIDFYETHGVSFFLSLSASEGLPVSIMEATSFGIPVLATRVGAVPEIVCEETGILVEPDDAAETIARAACLLLDGGGPVREEIAEYSRANFDAETNYGRFADLLSGV